MEKGSSNPSADSHSVESRLPSNRLAPPGKCDDSASHHPDGECFRSWRMRSSSLPCRRILQRSPESSKT
jgi:hypothetical protein